MALYHHKPGTRVTATNFPITIVAKHGPFAKPSGLIPGRMMSITVVSFKHSDELEGDTFLCTDGDLVADGGTEEIKAALAAAPLEPLTVEQITYALDV